MNDFSADLRSRVGAIQRIVAEARTEVFSDDYAVRVVAGPNGAVHDVELTSRAAKYSADELGELVVEQLKAASRQMSRELSEQLAGVLGVDATAHEATHLTSLPSADEIRRIRLENRRAPEGESK